MDAKQLLEQLLESGRKLAEQGAEKGSEIAAQGKDLAQQGIDYASEKLNLPEAGPERDKMLKNLGIGAAAGSLLALLVGTKTGRKVLSPAVKLGSLAALGGLGYKVYTEWQKSQGIEAEGTSLESLSGPEASERSLAIIRAMIGAAKSDGIVDPTEQRLITEEIKSSDLEGDASEILMAEIQKPLDVADIAAHSKSLESSIEIYLASLLLTDKGNEREQNYLTQLASALKLDSKLIANLEAEAFSPA